MPAEYDFMKSASEKEMPEEEYKRLRAEYEQKADWFSVKIKKTIGVFLGVYAALFMAAVAVATIRAHQGAYIWLAVQFLIVIFLYDPQAEAGKKTIYETDKRILLNSIKSRIASYKIKFGLVIGSGAFFLLLNIIWFIIYAPAPVFE